MKKMKRVLAILLTAAMTFGIAACDDSSGSNDTGESAKGGNSGNAGDLAAVEEAITAIGDHDTFVIGVVETQSTDETVVRREYYENYIADHYNVRFIFSEVCQDADSEISFIENCVDAGAEAIISFRGATDAYQMTQICQDYGMYYIFNGNREVTEETFQADFASFGGAYGSSVPLMAQAYKKYLVENASSDGGEGFLLASGIASRGNLQHTEVTQAMLETLAEMYELTYEREIASLAVTDAPTSAANDKGIEIYIYPGSTSNADWLPGISAALQTGKYSFLISCLQSYTQTAVAVEEVENAFDFNITVMTVGSTGNALTTAMNTQDKFGNPSVDFVAIQTASVKSAGLFAVAYNCLTGYRDNMRGDDGLMTKFEFDQSFVSDVNQLNTMEEWDSSSTGKWCADYEYIDGMLGVIKPDITAKEIQDHLFNVSTYGSIYARLEG